MNTAARLLLIIGASMVLVPSILPLPVHAGVNDEAKKAYERGDFDGCVSILARELRKKPDHQDNINLMETALPLAYNGHLAAAEEAAERLDWDTATSEYKAIISLRRVLSGVPPVPKKIEGKKEKTPTTFAVDDVKGDYDRALASAVQMHYDKAVAFESAGQYRSAAIEYRQTRDYDPTFKDAGSKYSTCREKALLKIAVMPFEDKTGKSYGALGDLLTQQVISSAMGSNPEFLQFVTRDYLQQLLAEQGAGQTGVIDEGSAAKLGKLLGVHAFVFGKLLTVVEDFPADVTEKADNTVEQYQGKDKPPLVFRCTYYLHKRMGKVTVQGSYQVVDVDTGVIKSTSNISKDAGDFVSWVTFTGAEEAVPNDVKKLNMGERALKPPQALVNEALNDLGKDLASALVAVF